MFYVIIDYSAVSKIDLKEVKEIVKDKVKKHKKYWGMRDLIDDLLIVIDEKSSFMELYKFL